MPISVLFFGATADATQLREVEVDLAIGTTIGDIVEDLTAEHPRLKSHKLLFAVNEEYATTDLKLNNGDSLAIFTPVSGG